MGDLKAAYAKGVYHHLDGKNHLLNLIHGVPDIPGYQAGRVAPSSVPLPLDGTVRDILNAVHTWAGAMFVKPEWINVVIDPLFTKAGPISTRQVPFDSFCSQCKGYGWFRCDQTATG